MQHLCKNDFHVNSARPTSPCDASSPHWWTSSETNTQQSSLPKFSRLKIGTQTIDYHSTKELGSQVRDQDSPSTRSTGQSYPGVLHWGGNNTHGQSIFSAQLGSYVLLSVHSSFFYFLSLSPFLLLGGGVEKDMLLGFCLCSFFFFLFGVWAGGNAAMFLFMFFRS